MGATKQSWIKRKANGNGIGWNKGQKGLCSTSTIEKMRKAKLGKPTWNKGKKLSEEHRKNLKGKRPNQTGENHHMFGKHHTLETKEKIRIAKSGDKCNLWKGGVSKISNLIRGCFQTRQWRSDVFTRDNYTCQKCGIKSGCGYTIYFEAHHIKSHSEILKENHIKTIEDAINCQELWNINNGITLCLKCHKETDTYAGRNRFINTNA